MNDELRTRWQDWERLPFPASQYPPGSEAGQVAGVDLALTDGDAAAIFQQFFEAGNLTHGEDHLRSVLSALDRALPALSEPGRTYFKEAADLLRGIHARLDPDRAGHSGSPSPPIIVVDDTRTATLYPSVQEAEASMEAIDVIDGGVYEGVFDRDGMRLVPRAEGYSEPVRLVPAHQPTYSRAQLREALVRTVVLTSHAEAGQYEAASVDELLRVLEKDDEERRRRSLSGRIRSLIASIRQRR